MWLSAQKLVFLMDTDGVRNGRRQLLTELSTRDAETLLAKRSKVPADVQHYLPCAIRAGCVTATSPPSTSSRQACGLSREREVMDSRDTAAIDASASPRKPSVAIAARSGGVAIFEVAWRATASASSSPVMAWEP